MKTKFDLLYQQIMHSEDTKYFDTVWEAENFLNKNFNGHGTIYSSDGKVLRTCRCMRTVHEQMGIPKVVVNMTLDEYEKQEKYSQDEYVQEYDAECTACGHIFALGNAQKDTEHDEYICPNCGSTHIMEYITENNKS